MKRTILAVLFLIGVTVKGQIASYYPYHTPSNLYLRPVTYTVIMPVSSIVASNISYRESYPTNIYNPAYGQRVVTWNYYAPVYDIVPIQRFQPNYYMTDMLFLILLQQGFED